MAQLSWNYTTFLNIAFLILATALVIRFLRTDGMGMLKMMGGGPDDMTAPSRPEPQPHQHSHGHIRAGRR